MKKLRVVHPLLFAAYPALFLFSNHPAEFSATQLAWALVLCVAGVALLWAGLGFALGSRRKSGLVASLLVFLFFNYGFLRALMPSEWGQWGAIAWLAVLVLGSCVIVRASRLLTVLNHLANFVGLVFVGLCVVNIGWFQFQVAGEVQREAKIEGGIPDGSVARDIYVIIVDAYARADVLTQRYQFDNAPFLEALRARGFYVAEEAIRP